MVIELPQKSGIFISYSHLDRKWLDELLVHLRPLRDLGLLNCWNDKEISVGDLWKEKIEQALNSTQVAILLVSPDFLASSFIAEEELPFFVKAASKGSVTILWIPISSSNYAHTEIVGFQAAHPPNRPLDTLKKADRHKAFVAISEKLLTVVASLKRQVEISSPLPGKPDQVEPSGCTPHRPRQIPRSCIRPTLFLGLGGAGSDVLRRLKSEFLGQFGTVPSCFSFLSVDRTDVETVDCFDEDERFLLQINNAYSYVDDPHVSAWWPQDLGREAIRNGWPQVRAIGRLALFANIVNFKNRIDEKLRALDEANERTGEDWVIPKVFIISSLAGGTGSGTFLDVAFTVRSAADGLVDISGIMVMPGIFKGVAITPTRLKANAYAALKELDHFMGLSFMGIRDNEVPTLGLGKSLVIEPPFDSIYLFDNVNKSHQTILDRNLMFDLIAQGLFDLTSSSMRVVLFNVMDNIKSALGAARGRFAICGSFGFEKCIFAPLEINNSIDNESAERSFISKLRRWSKRAEPLLIYDSSKIPLGREVYGFACCSVPNGQMGLLGKYIDELDHQRHLQFVSSDASSAHLFKIEFGVPLFALDGIESLRQCYYSIDRPSASHIHRDWVSFPDL